MLGVATTVAVAWVLAVVRSIPNTPRMTGRTFMLHGHAWSTAEHHLIGVTDIWWMDLGGNSSPAAPSQQVIADRLASTRKSITEMMSYRPNYVAHESPPPWGSVAETTHAADLPPAGVHGADTAFGFPLPCLWHRAVSPLKGNVSYAGRLEGGILLRGTAAARGPNDYTALPFRPLWPALALNTVVYAGVWMLALMGLGAVLTRRRVRQGLCDHCGYDLSGTAAGRVCPECGKGHARFSSGGRVQEVQ